MKLEKYERNISRNFYSPIKWSDMKRYIIQLIRTRLTMKKFPFRFIFLNKKTDPSIVSIKAYTAAIFCLKFDQLKVLTVLWKIN
jgi:hypothetical protein